MQTSYGHLTYCTNIHAGENWQDHFSQLKEHIPKVKRNLKQEGPFGIGLRLSNLASLELSKEKNLQVFQDWLNAENAYVFTMNGFPYGGFHDTVVKDKVHEPDWSTSERVAYTIRLFRILAALLPAGMEGGISTSPLSYKLWHTRCHESIAMTMESCTLNILLVVEHLAKLRRSGGPLLHLDIEPEPGGLIENSKEYTDWYFQYLLAAGIPFLQDKMGIDEAAAVDTIKTHIQLCYDVCHFAISYEDPILVLNRMSSYGLKTGKIQVSAALKSIMSKEEDQRKAQIESFKKFDEPTYLHQVIARKSNGQLLHYPDMPQALEDGMNPEVSEWRAHFHVPVFLQEYGALASTQDEIIKVLQRQKQKPFSKHLEVETYTWDVLPEKLQVNIDQAIARELSWVQQHLEH